MTSVQTSGTYTLGDRKVHRLGYGAMQLAGPGVFGPPKDRNAAIRVLREAVEQGVNHMWTLSSLQLHPHPVEFDMYFKC